MNTAAEMTDVFAQAGAPTHYFKGSQLQKRYGISPATFWRWKKPEHPFPEPRWGEGASARWALEDILEFEKSNQR